MTTLTCFKAYDIRGRVPDELNEDIVWKTGFAFADYLQAKKIVIGHDIRLTSPGLAAALSDGIRAAGCDVYDIGVCGTEEIYFATFAGNYDGGIVVTASHNPKDYNGMKLVREGSKPLSGDTGLRDIQHRVENGEFQPVTRPGQVFPADMQQQYCQHLLSYVDTKNLKPLKVVAHAGNGGAGRVVDMLESSLPFEWIKVQHDADGNFPNGVPNPLLPENRQPVIDAINQHKADLGIAWDGDFDRCFFFDEQGRFIEGYYVVGLLAESFLNRQPGARIVHDPRLTWNTIDIVEASGGIPCQSKTGHAFIKEFMRKEDAVYGGEMSAHHYFRDFAYCDSGMIPWLLVTELMCLSGKPLSALVDERIAAFPCSGEINRKVADPAAVMSTVENHYQGEAVHVDRTDGLSMNFPLWRFNLRMSNTEPLLRLNVESRGDANVMAQRRDELLAMIDQA
jgi:phosphomannomutase